MSVEFLMIVVHDPMHHTLQSHMRQRRHIDFHDIAMDSDPGCQARRKVQIGSVVLDRIGKQPRNIRRRRGRLNMRHRSHGTVGSWQ